MTHVEQGELQAYLDREVGADARADIDAHLHTCDACAAELDQLRAASSIFSAAVRPADVNAPTFAAYSAFRKARETAIAPHRFVALKRAAMLLIGFGALASAAIPGSPVRAWISDALRIVGVTDKPEEPAAPAARDVQPVVLDEKGGAAALSILPVDGRVRIILIDVSPEATVRVRLVDGDRAIVEAKGGQVAPRFRTSPGRIELVGVQKGEVTVDLPRSAVDARVEVDGRVLFETQH